MTANKLKLLACLSMLIDHITFMFVPRYTDIVTGTEISEEDSDVRHSSSLPFYWWKGSS